MPIAAFKVEKEVETFSAILHWTGGLYFALHCLKYFTQRSFFHEPIVQLVSSELVATWPAQFSHCSFCILEWIFTLKIESQSLTPTLSIIIFMNLTELPDLVLLIIFDYISLHALLCWPNVLRTCRRWNCLRTSVLARRRSLRLDMSPLSWKSTSTHMNNTLYIQLVKPETGLQPAVSLATVGCEFLNVTQLEIDVDSQDHNKNSYFAINHSHHHKYTPCVRAAFVVQFVANVSSQLVTNGHSPGGLDSD